MPQVSDRFTAYPISVTLDGSGNGTVGFQATGKNLRVTNIYGAVATQTLQAQATIYQQNIGARWALSNSNSGSTGFSANGSIDLLDGQMLYVSWTGGDPGAVATATFTGTAVPFNEVTDEGTAFVMSDPFAAGDGSIVFPALRSPNFVTGVSGWILRRDGTFELSGGTFRGDVYVSNGIDYVSINSNGPAVNFGRTASPQILPSSIVLLSQVSADGFTGLAIDIGGYDNGVLHPGPTLLGQSERGDSSDIQNFHIVPGGIGGGTASIRAGDVELWYNSVAGTSKIWNRTTGLTYRPTQTGTTSFNLAAVTNATNSIVFPEPYPIGVTPVVMTNLNSGSGQIRGWGSRANNVTNTGFDFFIFSPLTGSPTATLNPLPGSWTATSP